MQYKTMREKEADNEEKIFKDFNNFINILNSAILYLTLFISA